MLCHGDGQPPTADISVSPPFCLCPHMQSVRHALAHTLARVCALHFHRRGSSL